MASSAFFAAAVGAGFVLIGLVVYSYVRPHPDHRSAVTALLGLLGFALIASPNWTSISIRGEGLELELLREMQARQLQAQLQTELPAETTPSTPRPAPDVRRRRTTAATAARAARAAERREPTPTATTPPTPPPSPTPTDELFEAFSRGELDLRELSDEELLALNNRVTERRGGRGRR